MNQLEAKIFIFPKKIDLSKKQFSQQIYLFAQKYIQNNTLTHTSIAKTKNGKPYFTNNTTNPNMFLSLSHCKNQSTLILDKSPVAIDCELIKKRKYHTKILKKLLLSINFKHPQNICSNNIIQQTSQLSTTQNYKLLYLLWTFFEAYCKYHNNTLWKTFQHKVPLPFTLEQILSCKKFTLLDKLICFYHLDNNIICSISHNPTSITTINNITI